MESDGYRRLFISSAAVIFGVMGQSVARGWLAKDLTGSNAGLGGVMLAFGVAMLIATPWGGVAADRFPKRTVLLVAVAMLIASSLLTGLAVVTGVIRYWMLVAASAVQAAAFAALPAGSHRVHRRGRRTGADRAGRDAEPDGPGGDARRRPGAGRDPHRAVVVRCRWRVPRRRRHERDRRVRAVRPPPMPPRTAPTRARRSPRWSTRTTTCAGGTALASSP